jgi:hypothetical protein
MNQGGHTRHGCIYGGRFADENFDLIFDEPYLLGMWPVAPFRWLTLHLYNSPVAPFRWLTLHLYNSPVAVLPPSAG